MLTVQANKNTPWARRGETFTVETLSVAQDWHVNRGTLTVVDDGEPEPALTPKQAAVAKAEKMGLDTSGTRAQIEERIKEAEDGHTGEDEDSLPDGDPGLR